MQVFPNLGQFSGRLGAKSMLMGQFQHNIDPKGRVTMPSRFREDLGDAFYVTKGLDGCLFIFTPSAWMDFSDKLNQLPTSSKEARKLKRYFIGSSIECETDKQGRFLIPPVLRNFAEIDKEVTILGVSDKIEIWSTERYEEYQNEDDMSIEDIAGELDF